MSVDLNVDPSLQIDIPDALSERDKVKFTVHTKVSGRGLPGCTCSKHWILVLHGSPGTQACVPWAPLLQEPIRLRDTEPLPIALLWLLFDLRKVSVFTHLRSLENCLAHDCCLRSGHTSLVKQAT